MILIKQLLNLGFTEHQPRFNEPEFSYEWHIFKKHNSKIEVTTEYDLNGNPRIQFIEVNGEKLEGTPLKLFGLEFLMKAI